MGVEEGGADGGRGAEEVCHCFCWWWGWGFRGEMRWMLGLEGARWRRRRSCSEDDGGRTYAAPRTRGQSSISRPIGLCWNHTRRTLRSTAAHLFDFEIWRSEFVFEDLSAFKENLRRIEVNTRVSGWHLTPNSSTKPHCDSRFSRETGCKYENSAE